MGGLRWRTDMIIYSSLWTQPKSTGHVFSTYVLQHRSSEWPYSWQKWLHLLKRTVLRMYCIMFVQPCCSQVPLLGTCHWLKSKSAKAAHISLKLQSQRCQFLIESNHKTKNSATHAQNTVFWWFFLCQASAAYVLTNSAAFNASSSTQDISSMPDWNFIMVGAITFIHFHMTRYHAQFCRMGFHAQVTDRNWNLHNYMQFSAML